MKKEILERLETEVEACKRYTERAKEKAREGKIGPGLNLLDIANTAKTCAKQAHQKLWKATKGKLNEEEFKLFAEAETLGMELKKLTKK